MQKFWPQGQKLSRKKELGQGDGNVGGKGEEKGEVGKEVEVGEEEGKWY